MGDDLSRESLPVALRKPAYEGDLDFSSEHGACDICMLTVCVSVGYHRHWQGTEKERRRGEKEQPE